MQSLPFPVRPIHRAPKWPYTVHLLLLSRSFAVINDLQIPQTFHFIWSWHTKRMTTRTKANWDRERERGTGGVQWCVLNWNRMLKLSKHCSAGDLFSALPRGPLLYTRIDRQTEGCSVAIGKWFWVIYFIVALKYLLFWKAPNNAMINLKGLPCPPLATPLPPLSTAGCALSKCGALIPWKFLAATSRNRINFFLFSNLSPRSPCSSPSSSSCCWRNIFGFMWIRVIYSNRFRFRFRFRFGVALPSSPSKHIAAKWPLRALPCPPPFPGWPGYNSESIVMVLAACKFFLIISY